MQDENKVRVWVEFWEDKEMDFLSSPKNGGGGEDLHILIDMMMLGLGLIFPSCFLSLPFSL